MKKYSHEILTGVVSPVSWNSREDACNYSIYTRDKEEVLLMGKKVGRNYLKFKNKPIKVFGHFLSSVDGARVFEVTQAVVDNRRAA